MKSGFKNTKKQGDFGLGKAIAFFTKNGQTVSLPLTDSQSYDLIVDVDDKLYKIQVKTTFYKTKRGVYSVNLSTKGGNRSYNTIKKFDPNVVDFIFIMTGDEKIYLIPSQEIKAKNSLNVGTDKEKYRIE